LNPTLEPIQWEHGFKRCFQTQRVPRLQIGGQITFNYAMCLDNVQRRSEAQEMYKRCVGNPYGKISKQADTMLWGMTTVGLCQLYKLNRVHPCAALERDNETGDNKTGKNKG
jgi:hypothetical protein